MSGNTLTFNRIFGESVLNICSPLLFFSEWKRVSKLHHWPAQALEHAEKLVMRAAITR